MKPFYLVCIISLSICVSGVSGVVKAPQNSVIVPNVQGVALGVAVQILQNAELQPQYQSSASLTALVVQQIPGPGFELPLGGAVRLACEAAGQILTTKPVTTSQPRTLAKDGQPHISVVPVNLGATGVSVVPIRTTSTPRFYPAWYPRRFITNAATQPQVSRPQSVHVTPTVQPSVSLYGVPETEFKASLAWYPRPLLAPQQRTQPVITASPEIQSIIMVNVRPVIGQQMAPMPYLLRLSREDAIVAIQKAGLAVGSMMSVQAGRERAGLVLKQSPQFRALVPLGTQVDLWITN